MHPDTTGRRYAKALAGLLEKDSDLEAAAPLLRTLAAQAVPDREARLYWLSRRASRKTKEELLERLLESAKAPKMVQALLDVLFANNRVGDLPEIAEALDDVAAKRLGRTTARVSSAKPLSDAQHQAIVKRLRHLSGKDVRLEVKVDETLIGGVRVRLDNTVIDGSVRGRLEALVARFSE
jgi:F-type H+-transporting ATPase subunit delta